MSARRRPGHRAHLVMPPPRDEDSGDGHVSEIGQEIRSHDRDQAATAGKMLSARDSPRDKKIQNTIHRF
jgi:hypothetical protein